MPDTASEPRWASPRGAAEYLSARSDYEVPERTMRRWIAVGIVPATRLGPRRIFVDLNDLDRLRRPLLRDRPSTLTPDDEQWARRVAKSLLPLTDEQRARLTRLLSPATAGPARPRMRGSGKHDDGT